MTLSVLINDLQRLCSFLPHPVTSLHTTHLHHTQCTRPSHAWDIEFLPPWGRCGPMLGTRRWKGMRDFCAINFTYWDWMWKINSKLNGMFFRNSQTRAESAGFVGFSLYIYIYSDSTLFIWKSWGNLARHDWKAEGIDCSHVRPWEIGWIMPVSCISTNLSWKHF